MKRRNIVKQFVVMVIINTRIKKLFKGSDYR